MDTLKRDIGIFLKVLGAVLVTWLGAWIIVLAPGGSAFSSEGGWLVVPKVCASAMVVAGAAASIFFLWQKTLRIKVDTVERSLEAGPVGSEGEKKA